MDKSSVSIFLGDCSEYLANLAKEYDPMAWLLDHSTLENFEEQLHCSPCTVYTSLGDLPKDLSKVYNVLKKADVIFYCPPDQWSDGKEKDILEPSSSIQGLTEVLLMLLPKSINIQGYTGVSLKNYDPNPLVDQRKSANTQMWIAGCSVSHGVGVNDNQRYGALLAEELKLECSFLTRIGSAIDWSADQILRSDIRSRDIVVWGLTNWNRITYIHNHKLLSGITPTTYDYKLEYKKIVPQEQLWSDNTFYNGVYSIQKVINFCEKIGSKLFLVEIISGNYALTDFLQKQKNYIKIPYEIIYKDSSIFEKFLDLGSDLQHPGIKQHQEYKNIILNFINQC